MIVKPKIPCEREGCKDKKLCGQCGYMMQIYEWLINFCFATSNTPKSWQNACKSLPGLEKWWEDEKRMHLKEARKNMTLKDKIKAAMPLIDN